MERFAVESDGDGSWKEVDQEGKGVVREINSGVVMSVDTAERLVIALKEIVESIRKQAAAPLEPPTE